MIIYNNNSIDIIQGVIGYGNAEGITDWRLENTSTGFFNILNNTSTTPCLSIIDNGNVGIGTIPITSSSKLEIIGDINSSSYYKSGKFFLDDTSNYVLSTSNILVPRLLTELNSSPAQWTNVSTGIYYAPTFIKSLPNIITSSPTATTNGIVETDRYMSFTYTTDNVSGLVGQTQYTFTTTETLSVDILIIGGGGGGGNGDGSSNEPGGGGAGGMVYMTNKILNIGTYKVNVAKGGTSNQNGFNSAILDNLNNIILFDKIFLIGYGGGKGATTSSQTGSNGGSGGGGGHQQTNGGTATQGNTFWNGTAYVAGGFNGGRASASSRGGGGGGAGEAGSTDGDGFGGDGREVNITGTNTFYAGGGNAFPCTSIIRRSDGGGGILNGNGVQNGGNALPNTGSGGAGAYGGTPYIGGSGGSGIVIIRYRTFPTTTTIGIGVANPISKLHLYDDTISETKLTIQNNINNYTGNIITGSTDKYIIFSETSSFIISSDNANCDILMIGGGGGGSLGGGGAGACIVAINQILTSNNGNYTVVVGAGAVRRSL